MKKIIYSSVFLLSLFQFILSYASPRIPTIYGDRSVTAVGTGFSTTGVTVAGGTGAGSASNQLNLPSGIYIDGSGNLYVTDSYNHRIQKFVPGATLGVTVAGGNGQGTTPTQLNFPSDVFVDLSGNVFTNEANGARIQRWTPGASAGTTVAGGNGRGAAANQLNDPLAIYLDSKGDIYIADLINSRIQKWTPGASEGSTVAGGNGSGSAPNQLVAVGGVFVDQQGNVYVSDGLNNRVQKWAPGAMSGTTVAGGNGAGSAANQLTPGDIFVDRAGNVFVTDYDNNRVQKWVPGASEGITVAGGSSRGSAPDQLNRPTSVFLDQLGNMYVTDQGNSRVQKYAVSPVFTAPSCNATAVISWPEPANGFPSTISIPEELDLSRGLLTYMDTLSGHGYYKSSLRYTWPVARDISFYIGDTSASGHLLAIGGAAENNFINNKIKGSGFSPWIGLYNTGKPGQFSWVTGEPTTYTNWAPGEPNNSLSNGRFVKEPYARLQDGYGNWNDQRSDMVPFITEFDESLVRYKQVSGPANGSSQGVGIYPVCYERTNSITGEKETICFNVQVVCGSSVSAVNETFTTDISTSAALNGRLSVLSAPNPTNNYFRLKVATSLPSNKVDILVTDISGKLIESRKGVATSSPLQFGGRYRPGVYFVRVTERNEKVILRLVKQ